MGTIAGCLTLRMAWPRLSDSHASRSMFISCRMSPWVVRSGIRSAASLCSGNKQQPDCCSAAIITEPRRPKAYYVGHRLGWIGKDACGVNQGSTLETLFDPFLNVLVEPLESDGHGRPSDLVQHEIIHAGPRLAANVQRLAVPVPPMGGITYMADACFAQRP